MKYNMELKYSNYMAFSHFHCTLMNNSGLIIFYSQSCEKILSEYIDAIEKSGCEFKIRKLVKQGKNALMTLKAPEDSIRRRMLQEKSKPLNIAVEHARMQKRMVMRRKILSAFEGTEFEEMSSKIFDYAERSKGSSCKLLYTGSLHNFGRVDGTAIYKILKKEMEFYGF